MTLSDYFVPAYFAATISISCLIALLVLISGIRQQRTEYNVLAILSSLVALYQYMSMRYHLSTDVDTALYWLNLQTYVVICLRPIYFYAFARWARLPNLNIWTAVIGAASFILVLVNFFSEYTMRFSAIDELRMVELWNGESIGLLSGPSSAAGVLAHVLSAFVLVLMVFTARRFFRTGNKRLAILLAAVLVFQFVASFASYLIDEGILNFIYLAVLPLIALNVGVCALAAYEFRNQASRYDQLHAKTEALEHAISELAKGANISQRDNYYYQMLKGLYELTGAAYIFIGLKDTQTNDAIVNVKAVIHNGVEVDNFSYALKDTPCENVFNFDTCVYRTGVQSQFPKDEMLVDMHIDGYVGTPLIAADGELIGLLVMLDVKPLKLDNQILEAMKIFASRACSEIQRDAVEQKLRHMAYVDHASGLANKARLFEVLNDTFSQREQDQYEALLMLIDIDRFTQINSDFGYDAGEHVLLELGTRLNHYKHDNVFFARSGADEFAAVFYRTEAESNAFLEQQWESIRTILRRPIHVDSQSIRVDFSVGAVMFPQQTGRKYDVIQCAESALLQAKQKGRGTAVMFEMQLLDLIERRQHIDSQLRAALYDDAQLSMAYQPKTDQHGHLLAVEALLRWHHPQLGNVRPDEFIPIAERTELIVDLGDWVIKTVCAQLCQWKDEGFACKVAINISAAQFLRRDFADFVFEQLTAFGLQPHDIELEITEYGLLNDVERAIETLRALRNGGVTIALDDFGTGYSSLSYLRELPLDVLKIDKSFVDKINEDSAAQLIKTIIAIGQQQSLTIVAEGTETKEQVQLLAKMGCDSFQGYYFSKPIDGKAIPGWKFEQVG
ncbi:EAL domain-containing protein [Glaciecola sp. XM2]|jgi:diguanylate cyclase (GGDEF)-like protein|uniref:EAL domain-containing protein n=1 Tax=Glaciecola sp. XM2 TaxID=1914931 RepID=UPI001BDF4B5E|nr:EAL domain-containing protein [Glaciecola sp. XM2]MBT1451873.1 EAL domain-containing protein [Glaciecola sp. XM2]